MVFSLNRYLHCRRILVLSFKKIRFFYHHHLSPSSLLFLGKFDIEWRLYSILNVFKENVSVHQECITDEFNWLERGCLERLLRKSNIAWKWKSVSCIWLFVTPWTIPVCGIFQARILEWVAYPFSSRFSQMRNWTRSPALQADSLPTELLRKPNIAWAELEKWGRWGLEVFPGISNTTFQGKWPHGVLRYLKEAKDG